jgi:NAD(P) transhydrogenase subunit beta
MVPELTVGATGLLAVFLFLSGLGMTVVILATVLYVLCVNGEARVRFPLESVLAAVAFAARRRVTALYNFMGGLAVCAIAATQLFATSGQGAPRLVLTAFGAFIGAVSLTGSLITWAKLEGIIGKPSWATVSQGRGIAVMISIYNALIGIAVSLEGIVLASPALVIAGLGIAAARLFLTLQMTGAGNGEPPWGEKLLPGSIGRKA